MRVEEEVPRGGVGACGAVGEAEQERAEGEFVGGVEGGDAAG